MMLSWMMLSCADVCVHSDLKTHMLDLQEVTHGLHQNFPLERKYTWRRSGAKCA